MEVTFTTRHFLIFFQFRYLLSVRSYCSYDINSVLKMFIDECWTVKKIVKKGAISPIQFFRKLHHILFPILFINHLSIHEPRLPYHSAEYPIAQKFGQLRYCYQYENILYSYYSFFNSLLANYL